MVNAREKTYPNKHVQLGLASFLQFFYLNLARVANIQVVDSWSSSVPKGEKPGVCYSHR